MKEQYIEYESFDDSVDEYFTAMDRYKENSKVTNKENKIMEKVSKIKDD